MSLNEDMTRDAAGASVEGVLNYVAPDCRESRRFVFPGNEVNTGRFVPHRVTIRNARRASTRPTLDTMGFELFGHKSRVQNFRDRAEIDAVYPDEVMAAIRDLTGADLVVPMGYVLRDANETGNGAKQPPASDVHVDISQASAPRIGQGLFAEHAPQDRTYRRFIASSFWRTFSPPPQDWPLALCDGTSISQANGIPNRLVRLSARPDPAAMQAPIANEQELPAATIFHYHPDERWYYYPDMNRDEVVLLKLHDSNHDRAWFTAHTAFHDAARTGTITRESIEFRTIAYWY
ncbi:MAG: CmcJ/NvfI family oxidoreductase [Stellaceae bacterium]